MNLILAALLVLAPRQDVSPRLRTELENGATVLAERLPGARSASVQLFVRLPKIERHGEAHLLEHVWAKGGSKSLDARLEAAGGFLHARTLRDAICFEVVCGPRDLGTAFEALTDLLKPLRTDDDEMGREIALIGEEIGLRTDADKLGSAAWSLAYGDEGVDPLGSTESLRGATSNALADLAAALLKGGSIVLSIASDVDPAIATERARTMLSTVQRGGPPRRPQRKQGSPGRVEAPGASGEARAALVPSYRDPRTTATLAAALAIASQFDSALVTYTPADENGLIVVGRTDENSGVGLKIDALEPHDVAALFPLGKLLARNWVERRMASPSGSAFLRGLLLLHSPASTPERLLEQIDGMTRSDFAEGMARLRKDDAVVVVGVKG